MTNQAPTEQSDQPEKQASDQTPERKVEIINNFSALSIETQTEIQNKIDAALAQAKEKESKYLYLYADFENFKKRVSKERIDLMKYGWESVARDLLQVIDNLERALSFTPASTDKNLLTGLNMVLGDFKSTLQRQGVQKIETTGQVFNPELHEGVLNEPSDLPAGTIVKELLGGYTLHGRLLRPSKVAVSTGKASDDAA